MAEVGISMFEKVLSAQEASDLLGIHPVTLLRWAREGRIPHRRLGEFEDADVGQRDAVFALEIFTEFIEDSAQVTNTFLGITEFAGRKGERPEVTKPEFGSLLPNSLLC